MLDRIAPRPGEGPSARVDADRRHARRVPVAGHRRKDPGRVARHRHGRHLGHRAFRQAGGGSRLEERLRLPSLGGVVFEYARVPGHAIAPATPNGTPSPITGTCLTARSGRCPPRFSRVARSASTRQAGQRLHQAPARPVLTAPDSAVHLRVDRHSSRRGCHQDGPAAHGSRASPRTAARGGQGRRGDHAPDEPRRELAGRAALDRPPGTAVPPPDEQPHRLQGDRLAVLHHLHQHPGLRHGRRAGQPPPRSTSTWSAASTCVETSSIRTAKAMGLRGLPSKSWQVNCGWVIAANIAADLAAWTRLPRLLRRPGPARSRP